jgi:hypothetical protein
VEGRGRRETEKKRALYLRSYRLGSISRGPEW